MSAPLTPVSITFDEMEQQLAKPADPIKTEDMKLEGDDVPEHLRGKTAKDALSQLSGALDAIKVSEDARKRTERDLELALQNRQAPPPPSAPVPTMTDEQLAELHQMDPIKAIRYMSDRAIREAEANLSGRLEPMFVGTAAEVERRARETYKDEFALFGDQISQMASTLPNAKAALANPKVWDDVVALVRGRRENFDRLLEHKAGKKATDQRTVAQQQQAADIGFTDNSQGSRPIPRTVAQLDPIQREVAEKLNMTPEEYIKWGHVS